MKSGAVECQEPLAAKVAAVRFKVQPQGYAVFLPPIPAAVKNRGVAFLYMYALVCS